MRQLLPAMLLLALVLGAGAWLRGAARPAPCVVINEVLASNREAALDDRRATSDWVELHVPCDDAVDLTGYHLSDDHRHPTRSPLPPLTIPGGGHQLVWLSGERRHGWEDVPLERFQEMMSIQETLVGEGDSFRVLTSPEPGAPPPEGWRDVSFDDRDLETAPSGFGNDLSWATQWPLGLRWAVLRRTFRVPRAADIRNLVLRMRYDDGFVAYLNGVEIARANAHDGLPNATRWNDVADVELHDVSGHAEVLVDGDNLLAVLVLNTPGSSDLAAVPELLVPAELVHADFDLSRRGGHVVLADPDGRIIDRVTYSRQRRDQSFGRQLDEPDRWAYYLTPTPGLANTAPPHAAPSDFRITFSPPPAVGPLPSTVTIEAEPAGASVRYTTDGSEPTSESAIAGEPVELDESTVLRAAAFVGDERATPVRTASYLARRSPGMRVLSVSLGPREFAVIHADEARSRRRGESRAALELFGADGRREHVTGCGLRLHGGGGRHGEPDTKKSFKLAFRNEYGSAVLRHPIFEGETSPAHDKLVLRAGFNDRFRPGRGGYNLRYAYLRDQVVRELHAELGGIEVRGTWYVLHVNGRYWGLYNVTDRPDAAFARATIGDGPWDVVKAGNEARDGQREDWMETWGVVRDDDLELPEKLAHVEAAIDLADFTDYALLNLWAQNEDWPQNNWVVFRRQADGERWRFACWDAETTLGLRHPGADHESLEVVYHDRDRYAANTLADLLDLLLRSEEHVERFQARAEVLLDGVLSEESVRRHVEANRKRIAPAMPAELELFGDGQSLSDWERNVDRVAEFAEERAQHFRAMIRLEDE